MFGHVHRVQRTAGGNQGTNAELSSSAVGLLSLKSTAIHRAQPLPTVDEMIPQREIVVPAVPPPTHAEAFRAAVLQVAAVLKDQYAILATQSDALGKTVDGKVWSDLLRCVYAQCVSAEYQHVRWPWCAWCRYSWPG